MHKPLVPEKQTSYKPFYGAFYFTGRLFFIHGTKAAYLFQVFVKILLVNFQLQGVHRGIGLYRGGIYGLGMPAYHPFFYTKAQNIGENFLEYRLGNKATGPTDRAVQGMTLVDIVTYEI